MVECVAIMLAEYPIVDREGKLSICGIVDTVQFVLKAGPPPDTVPGAIGITMPISMVAILSASIADGLQHTFGLIVRHEDGKDIVKNENAGTIVFTVNKKGRRPRANLIVELKGMAVPAAGDYEVILLVGGKDVGRTQLYVEAKADA